MKVFLDIGGHLGETLEVVQDEKWNFDRIVCFEPAPSCWPHLEAVAGDRTTICHFGLWKEEGTIILHNEGAIGASLSADKNPVETATPCEFRDVAAWFSDNISEADEVFVKINTEGAEADIIERLASADLLGRIDHLLIHFDVRKVPSLRHREAGLRSQLIAAGIEFHAAEDIQFGGIPRGTRNWLRWCHADPRFRDIRYKRISAAEHAVRKRLYPLKEALRHSRAGSVTRSH